MLRRGRTLRSGKQIEYIVRKGKRINSRFFRATVIPVREAEAARVLCITSKKNIKKAVQRNYTRRRVYYLYALYAEKMSKYHVVIYPQNAVKDTEFQVIEKDFLELVQKIS